MATAISIRHVARTRLGNIYFMTGQDGDNFAGLPGTPTVTTTASQLFSDIVITKLTPARRAGVYHLCRRRHDGLNPNNANVMNGTSDGFGIAVDPAGNVYFGGKNRWRLRARLLPRRRLTPSPSRILANRYRRPAPWATTSMC